MNIIVCVKQVPDPEIPPAKFQVDAATNKVIPPPGVPPVMSVFDERAVEAACRLKDKNGGKITVISVGLAKAADIIKHAVAMGADEGYVITDPAFENLDAFGIAYVLSKAIQKIGAYDVVLCGRQSADWGHMQTGSILAEVLGIPVVTVACEITAADNKLKVKRIVKDGWEVLDVSMPCLITVTSEIGMPRLPAGVRIMLAARKPIPVWKASDIAVDMEKITAHTEVLSITVPKRKTECEMITGATAADAAVALAQKINGLL